MDYTASQQIANIVADMEPGDAIQVLSNQLRALGAAVCLYTREDVLGQIDEYYDEHTLTDGERERIADAVMDSYGWRHLEDAGEDDWDTINGEIQSAANDLDLSTRLGL